LNKFLRFALGGSYFLFVAFVALWRGGKPERIIAIAMLIAAFGTPLVQMRPIVNNVDYSVLTVDSVLLLVMFAVALKSDRWWPLFCTAFHLISVGIHVMKLTRPDISHSVYATIRMLFSNFSILALGAGVVEIETRRWLQHRTLVRGE